MPGVPVLAQVVLAQVVVVPAGQVDVRAQEHRHVKALLVEHPAVAVLADRAVASADLQGVRVAVLADVVPVVVVALKVPSVAPVGRFAVDVRANARNAKSSTRCKHRQSAVCASAKEMARSCV